MTKAGDSGINLSDAVFLASNLFAAGNLAAAKEQLNLHLECNPGDVNAHFLRAGISVRFGLWDDASEDCDCVLAEDPNHYECLVLLGLVRKNQVRFAESIDLLTRAAALNPQGPSALNTLGMSYLSMRQIDKAIEAFQQALNRSPRSGAIYQNLGLALRLAEKRHRALKAFQMAVKYAPENPTNFISLSEQLRRMGMKPEAIQCLVQGRKRHPRCLPILLALASTYGDAQRPREAEELFEECMDIEPSTLQAYALWLQDQGRFGDAVQKLSRSIELHPNQGLAYMAMAEVKQFELADGSSWVDRAKASLQDPSVPKISRMYLWYAIAKSNEHGRLYQDAMRAYDEANHLAFSIYTEGRPFDQALGRRLTERTTNLYSSEEFHRARTSGSSSIKPIFVVGMVRSGTTLLDQIISSHSRVKSGGESTFWMEESDRLYASWRDGVVLGDLMDLATRYLRVLEDEAGESPHITDKMPLNYLNLGHIHVTFPHSKVLHIRRNPIDTCLSIYATHFGGGPHFAYKKENIVFYYGEYLRLMEHWRRVLPSDCFFELDYEELVTNKRSVVEDVLAFCGLQWEEACVHHEENASAITTPSRWQARQPTYTSSVEKWRAFEPWLGAFETLKQFSHPPIKRTKALQ